MTFLAVSDIHLGAKLFNIPELGQDLLDCLVKIVDKAIELKVDVLIVAGDLYDVRRPSESLIHFVNVQFERLRANGIEIVAIAGDHDKPTDGKSWVQDINGAKQNFKGIYSCNYTDFINLAALVESLALVGNDVEWLVLHGQVPEIFKYVEEKKHLNLRQFDFSKFPKLKGIILGDIHKPGDILFHDEAGNRKIPIVYCGSPGIVKSDEVGQKIGLLYYNGKELTRVPFELERQFIRIPIEQLRPISGIYPKKPVYLIECTSKTKELLKNHQELYKHAIVRPVVMGEKDAQGNVQIRSELNTSERITSTLRQLTAGDEELFQLGFQLLNNEDPKAVLDQFKLKKLDEKENS